MCDVLFMLLNFSKKCSPGKQELYRLIHQSIFCFSRILSVFLELLHQISFQIFLNKLISMDRKVWMWSFVLNFLDDYAEKFYCQDRQLIRCNIFLLILIQLYTCDTFYLQKKTTISGCFFFMLPRQDSNLRPIG